MAIQHEAAEVVLRVMAQVDNALKGFKQVSRQAKKTQEEITDFGGKFAKEREAFMKNEAWLQEKYQQDQVRSVKRATQQMMREAGKRNKAFMDQARGNPLADRSRVAAAMRAGRRASGAGYRQKWFGSQYGHTFLNSPMEKLRRQNQQAQSKNRNSMINRMIGRSIPKGSMNAVGYQTDGQYAAEQARNAARAIPDFGARRVAKGTVTRLWAGIQARKIADNAISPSLQAGINRARARQVPDLPLGHEQQAAIRMLRARRVVDLPLPRAMQDALNTHRLNQTYGPAARGTYGPNITPGMRAARGVQDRGLPPEMAARLAKAREIGGPLSMMPGTLGKIVAGFKAAATSKDAFAANVFAKMPPAAMICMNVARAAWRIGSWGFTTAVSGVGRFVSAVASMPGAVARAMRSVASHFSNSVGNLQALGTKLRTAGIYTTAALTLPLVGMAKGSITEGSDFNKAMVEAQARAGVDANGNRKITPELMQAMSVKVSDMTLGKDPMGKTKFSAVELAQGYKELAAAGVEANALIETIPRVAILAQNAEVGLAEATVYLTTTLGAFNKTSKNRGPVQYAEDMKEASNVMTTVANITNASVDSVAKSMTADSASAARQYGMNIQQLGAILAAYAESGKLAENAGNLAGRGFNLMQSSFLRKGDVWKGMNVDLIDKQTGAWVSYSDAILMLDKAFVGMKAPQVKAQMLKMGMGILQQKSITPLLGKGKTLKQYEKEIALGQQGKGSAMLMSENLMESFENKMLEMWNAIKEVQRQVFNELRPYLEMAAEAVTKLANAFLDLDPATKKSIIVFLAALAVIGPVLLGLGTVVALAVAGFSLLGAVLSPIGLLFSTGGILLTGVLALGAAFASSKLAGMGGLWAVGLALANRFVTFVDGFTKNFPQNLQAMGVWMKELWGDFTTWASDSLTAIGEMFAAWFPNITALWKDFTNIDLGAGLSTVMGFFVNLPENINKMREHAGAMWDHMIARAMAGLEPVGAFYVKIFVVAAQTIGTVLYNTIIGVFTKIVPLLNKIFGAVSIDILSTLPGGGKIARSAALARDVASKNSLKEKFQAVGGFGPNVKPEDQAIYDKEWALIEKQTKETLKLLDAGQASNLAGQFMEDLGRASLRAEKNPIDAFGGIILDGLKAREEALKVFDQNNPVPQAEQLNLGVPDFEGPQLNLGGGKGFGSMSPVGNNQIVGLLRRIASAVEGDESLDVRLSNIA